jgi:uncharacterized radical SAM protein YgiQ
MGNPGKKWVHMTFLPMTIEEMRKLGWEQPDFVLVTGDAYVDHPSFGAAIIGRLLERYGYKVAILAQPDWKSADDFRRFGRPRLGFLITSGNVDSMVNHFSVTRHRRKTDKYAPGGEAGKRPDRAVIVYSNRAREAFKDVPIILGGLEASLRRLAHYDYWEDGLRRSILLDSKADLLVYGMAERAILEIAEAMAAGISVKDITWIRGTCHVSKSIPEGVEYVKLPDFDALQESKDDYCKSFAIQYKNNDSITAVALAEGYNTGLPSELYVIQNPPQPPLEREELDDLYSLTYMRNWHPIYDNQGGVPALEEIQFSITANRGCFGSCSFCALTYHQGRQVRSRSKESIVKEARLLAADQKFKGYIHDIGGPTANFRNPSCKKQLTKGVCPNKECLFPQPCKELEVDHSEYLDVLQTVRQLPGIKKVFIRSGIRYDYLMADPDDRFFSELCQYHVSGTLKVAPEHVAPGTLRKMRKPGTKVYEAFQAKYKQVNRRLHMDQYLIPYYISSHPGCTLDDAIDLAVYLKQSGFVPEQVQDFYPTPGTLATCMYYTEKDPFTLEPVYVAKTSEDKRMQRALLQFNKKENRTLVEKALKKAGRTL